jgi:hypothetical protein
MLGLHPNSVTSFMLSSSSLSFGSIRTITELTKHIESRNIFANVLEVRRLTRRNWNEELDASHIDGLCKDSKTQTKRLRRGIELTPGIWFANYLSIKHIKEV